MIKVENWTTAELARVGHEIGKAFAAEKEGFVAIIPESDVIKSFEIITEYLYNADFLYRLSEMEDAYIAFWRKGTKIPFKHTIHMIWRMLREVRLRSALKLAHSGSEQYVKLYRKERDYIAIFLVAVLQESQGKGYLHRMLNELFIEANQENIFCVLDTDTELKVRKYEACGMTAVHTKNFRDGTVLYTMAYLPK